MPFSVIGSTVTSPDILSFKSWREHSNFTHSSKTLVGLCMYEIQTYGFEGFQDGDPSVRNQYLVLPYYYI
ncbi:hypothetical protein QCA50_000501 [Cerrena zonata]|uniref:Uncharacterized protein n=1 Tax=Cerrena zonata TaxID=2478898 RepID=A0AAW0GQG4_9APHY